MSGAHVRLVLLFTRWKLRPNTHPYYDRKFALTRQERQARKEGRKEACVRLFLLGRIVGAGISYASEYDSETLIDE